MDEASESPRGSAGMVAERVLKVGEPFGDNRRSQAARRKEEEGAKLCNNQRT